MALAVLAGGVAAWLTLRGIHAHSQHQRDDFLLAGACILLLVVFVRGAAHAEHRARSCTDAYVAAYSPARSVFTSLAVGSKGARRFAPVVMSVFSLLFVVLLAGLVVVTVLTERAATKSRYVQQSGVAARGVVDYVQRTTRSQRYGDYTTSLVGVSFTSPVAGTTHTTVHVPAAFTLRPSRSLTVLVDPEQPTYAELSGEPYVPRSALFELAAADVVVLVLAYGAVASRVRMGVRRRRALATGTIRAGAPEARGELRAEGARSEAPGTSSAIAGSGRPVVDPASGSPAGGVGVAAASSAGSPTSGSPTSGSPTAGFPVTSRAATSSAPDEGVVAVSAQAAGDGASPGEAGAAGVASRAQPEASADETSADEASADEAFSPGTADAEGSHGDTPLVHPPAWHDDPYGRHRMRYWDGTTWTQWVSDGSGSTSSDPLTPIS